MNEEAGPCPASAELEALVQCERDGGGEVAGDATRSHVARCRACSEWVENARFEREFSAAACAPGFAASLLEPMRPELPGYEILRGISAGGQGIVYEALQVRTRRRVAVKILRHGHGVRRSQRARFEREIEIAAALHNPGIVAVYDSIALPSGRHALVLELVEGESLEQRIDEFARTASGRRAAVELVARICDAVLHAHQRGVIHRDLKPSNILIDTSGAPRILDFGVACWFGTLAPEPARITLPGEFAGTLAYAAPEQVAGEAGPPDLRSDLYAIGVILYQACVGELPYEVGGTLETVIRNISSAPPAVPQRGSLDTDLWIIISKAIAKDPERRYQSAAAMSADLRRYLAGESIEARRDSGVYVLRKLMWRYRYVAAGVFLSLAGLLALGARLQVQNTRLHSALRASIIDQARARGAGGNRSAAQAMLASELLRIGEAIEHPQELMFGGTPEQRSVLWADAELQAFQPCFGTTELGAARAADAWWEPDRVCVVFTDGFERRWSLPDLQLVSERRLMDRPPIDVRYSPRTDRLLVRFDDKLQCIEAATGRVLGEKEYASDVGSNMTLAPTGDSAAVWSRSRGMEVFSLPGFETILMLRDVAVRQRPWISEKGDRAAFVQEDGRLLVFGLPSGKLESELQVVALEQIQSDPQGPEDQWRVTGTDSGEMLAVGRRRRVWLYDAKTGSAQPPILTTIGNLVEASFMDSGRWLVIQSNQDSRVLVWSIEERKERAELPGHAGGVSCVFVSPDERYILTVDKSQVMRLWSGPEAGWRKELGDSPTGAHDLALDSRREAITGAFSNGTIETWLLRTPEPPATTPVDSRAAYCVGYSPVIDVTAAGGAMGEIVLLRDGKEIAPRLTVEPGMPVRSVRFSPDGRFLAACAEYGSAIIIKTGVWSLEHRLEIKSGRLTNVGWSPDGKLLAVAVGDGRCRVYAAPDFRLRIDWRADSRSCRAAEFSPDGSWIATGGENGTLRIWDTNAWKLKHEISINQDAVFCLAFHPKGHVLSVGDRSGRVTQVGMPEGKVLAGFSVGSPVMALEYCDSSLVVGSIDKPVEVWDFAMLGRCVRSDAEYLKRVGELAGGE